MGTRRGDIIIINTIIISSININKRGDCKGGDWATPTVSAFFEANRA